MVAGLLAFALLGNVSARAASTFNWTATSEGDYATPENWTALGPPGSADTAVLGNSTVASGTIDFTISDTYTLNTLQMGNVAGTTAFNMSGGSFTINKSSTGGLVIGNANGANATFTLDDGALQVIRPSTYYQDCVAVGNASGSTGELVINGGTSSFQCGVEIGIHGTGTVTINDGDVYCSGWWNAGRGFNSGNQSQNEGDGTFNLNGGTLWLQQTAISAASRGLYVQQTALNGTANINGGTLIAEGIRVMNANTIATGAANPTATLNVSGGDLYLGANGMSKAGTLAGGVAIVNLSGGTFHTTNSISGGQEDWTWNANLPATLTSGTTTFAPAAGSTITLDGTFSGDGGLAVSGPGTVLITANHTYKGDTTVSGGTLLVNGSLAAESRVNVTGGVLGGIGTIGGPTTIGAGTLAPGQSPGTLTFGSDLTLSGTSLLAYDLAGNDTTVGGGVNDLATVAGTLTLDGTLNVSEIGAGSFLSAVAGDEWRLFDYTTGLTDNGLELGTMPTLADGLGFQIDTATSGQVNLMVVSVPEPCALALGLLGAVVLAGFSRKRRRG